VRRQQAGRTGSIAEDVGVDIGNTDVIHRPGKEGLGNAYRHGFRIALDDGADIVIQMVWTSPIPTRYCRT
jgi:hypothetical protein